MDKAASMSTSTAILLGSVIIALSVYVALGRQPPAQPVTPAVEAVTPTIETPPPAVVVTPPETVAAQASEAIAYQLASLRARCPAPPGEHKFTFNVTFNAEGIEVAHGISADRRNPKTLLASCLSGALAPLRVPPPGATTAVEVPLNLP